MPGSNGKRGSKTRAPASARWEPRIGGWSVVKEPSGASTYTAKALCHSVGEWLTPETRKSGSGWAVRSRWMLIGADEVEVCAGAVNGEVSRRPQAASRTSWRGPPGLQRRPAGRCFLRQDHRNRAVTVRERSGTSRPPPYKPVDSRGRSVFKGGTPAAKKAHTNLSINEPRASAARTEACRPSRSTVECRKVSSAPRPSEARGSSCRTAPSRSRLGFLAPVATAARWSRC